MKLSTSQLVKIFVPWISDPVIISKVMKYYCDDEDMKEHYAEELGCEPSQFKNKMTMMWTKTSNWKRQDKYKIDNHQAADWSANYCIDFAGQQIDKNSITANCIERIFCNNKDPFSDNFRIEILTDPTDTKVLAWNLIVD